MPRDLYWPDQYLAKRRTAQEALAAIRGGWRVFIGTSCGEPQHLVQELARQSCNYSDLEIVRLMSLEATPLTLIANQSQCHTFSVRSFYLGSAKPRSLAAQKRFITPINLSAVPRLFKSGLLPINVALIQVSPPDDFGWMSLGVSVDVTLAAAQSASLVIAQVNPRMPRVMGQSFIHVSDVDVLVEHEEDLITTTLPPDSEAANRVARHVAKLVEDGSTLQLSLGNSPQATLMALSDKNDLGVHTQFLTDGIMRLVGLGVINNRKKGLNQGKCVASGAIGSRNLYDFLDDNPGIEFLPSDYVNDPAIIARHNKMVSLNVAMGIDLTGQVACDALPHNLLSGVTGVMDFVRGSQQSAGGKSVIMLPSTTLDGSSSRIVPMLENTAVVIPRGDVQLVATEYGVVNLFGRSLQERAMALISIAHPDFRDALFESAKDLRLLGPERTMRQSFHHGVYPVQLEQTRDYDGQRVLFRPARPVDERLIQEHFYNLAPEDVVARFFHEKTCFLREEVEEVSQIDYVKDLTLVAVVGEQGFEKVIAVGGYFLDHSTNLVEVAFSVDRQWRGKGLGAVILEMLAQWAREHGFAGLVAYTTPSNQGMIKLFKKLRYPVRTSLDEGVLVLTARFDDTAAEPGSD